MILSNTADLSHIINDGLSDIHFALKAASLGSCLGGMSSLCIRAILG